MIKAFLSLVFVLLLTACDPVSKPTDEAIKTIATLCEKHNKVIRVYYTSSTVSIECDEAYDK